MKRELKLEIFLKKSQLRREVWNKLDNVKTAGEIAKKLGKLVDKFELVMTSIDGTPESTMDEIDSVRDKACSIVDQASEVLGDGITCTTSLPPRG